MKLHNSTQYAVLLSTVLSIHTVTSSSSTTVAAAAKKQRLLRGGGGYDNDFDYEEFVLPGQPVSDDGQDDDDVDDDELETLGSRWGDITEIIEVDAVDDDDVVILEEDVEEKEDELEAFAEFVHDTEGADSPPVNLEDIIVEEVDEDDDDDDDDDIDEDEDEDAEEEEVEAVVLDGQQVVESEDDADEVAEDDEEVVLAGQQVDSGDENDDADDADESLGLFNTTGTDADFLVEEFAEEEPQEIGTMGDAETEQATNNAASANDSTIPENEDTMGLATISDLPNSQGTVFYGHKDFTCRSSNGSLGVPGEEYSQYRSVTRQWCETECTTEVDCKAYDYNEPTMQCQIWYFFYNSFEPNEGSFCYYKSF